MKKAFRAGLIVAIAALGITLFYTAGFNPFLRAALHNALPYPVDFKSAHPTGPLSFRLNKVTVDLPSARAEADRADVRLSVSLFPPQLVCDNALSGIRIGAKSDLVRKKVSFETGRVRVARRFKETRIDFPEWKTGLLEFAGEATMDGRDTLKALHVAGSVDPAFLTSFFPGKKAPDNAGERVPFDARLGEGILEIQVRGKRWFRSTWVMRS